MANAIYAADGVTVLQPLASTAAAAAQLASGSYAIGHYGGAVDVYDPAQTLVATTTVAGHHLALGAGASLFAVVTQSDLDPGWNAYQLDAAGTTTLTLAPAPGLPAGTGTTEPDALALAGDGTTLFYAGSAGSPGDPTDVVFRYDLTTGTGAGTFVTRAGFSVTNILIRATGEVVVGWQGEPDPATSDVVRYDAAGGVQATYAVGQALSIALDPDGLTWWVRLAAEGTIARRRFSDGAVVATLTDGLVCPHWFVTATALGGGDQPPYVAPSYHLDARAIRRLRRAPHVNNENTRVFFRTFELDLERGQGLATGQGSDPMVLLRISRDGGQTWGEEIRMAAGRLGDYTQRVMARRLGQARDTVFEVVVSDPIAWSLVGAWLDLEPGTS